MTLALLGLIVVLSFPELLTGDRVPVYRDLLTVVIPFRAFLADHLHQGKIPLWNPFIDLGTPFLAALHGGALYPPSLLLLAPFPLGFDWLVLIHYLIALAGFWAWLRERELPPAASAVGSLTFVLGGYLVSMMNLTTHLEAGAWAPWVLLAWSRYLRRPTPRAFAALVLLLTLQLLAGSPETVSMTIILVAAWTTWTARFRPRAVLRALGVLGAAVALVLVVAGAQVLPTLEYLAESDRSGPLPFEEVAYWSLEPRSLLQLVLPQTPSLAPQALPNTFGPIYATHSPWVASFYLGLVPLCLCVAGMVQSRERWFWSTCLVLSIGLAFGEFTPLFPLLHRLAPLVVARFRYPEKFFFLAHLSACVLAADGAKQLIRGDRRAMRLVLAIGGIVLAIGGLPLLFSTVSADVVSGLVRFVRGPGLPQPIMTLDIADLVAKSVRATVIVGVFLAVVGLGWNGVLRPPLISVLVLGIVATDLSSAHHDLNLSMRWKELANHPLVFDANPLRRDGTRLFHYRTQSTPLGERTPIPGLDHWQRPFGVGTDLRKFSVDAWRVSFLDLGMIDGIGNVGGFDGITRASDALLLSVLAALPRERAIDLLALLSVSTLIGPTPLDSPQVEPLRPEAQAGVYAYRIRRSLPVAYVVTRLRPATTEDDALNILLAPSFVAGSEAVVDRLPAGWNDAPDAGIEPDRAVVVLREDTSVRIVARAANPALVVLNDSWSPGWEALVDGAPAEILRTNVFVRGVAIAAGEHTIEFCYHPRSVRVGALISVAGLAVLLGLVVAGHATPHPHAE